MTFFMQLLARASNSSPLARSQQDPLALQPIKSAFLAWTLRLLPWLMLAALPFVLWPNNPIVISGREMFATGMFTAACALFAFQVLMRRIADILPVLERRQLLKAPANQVAGDGSAPSAAGDEIQDVQATLSMFKYEIDGTFNSRTQWILAIAITLLVPTWFVVRFSWRFIYSPLLVVGLLVEAFIGAIIGLMVWRMIVVGWLVWQLPHRFKLVPHYSHPDQCGGLEPVGNLCLWNALIVTTAGVFLGGWIAIGPHTAYAQLAIQYAYEFRLLLSIPIVLAAMSFVLPLWTIHTAMSVQRAELLAVMDKLTHELDVEVRELVTKAETIDPAELERRTKRIEGLRQVYNENYRMPDWPINVGLVMRFASAQAVPVLTFLGVTQPIVDLVAAAFKFAAPGNSG